MVDKLTTYVLKGIDADLWKRFKITCIYNDVSIKSVLINAIKDYVKSNSKDIDMS